MKRSIIALCLACAPLAACAGTMGRVTSLEAIAVASTSLDALQARYDRAKAFAALFLPLLPDDQEARVRVYAALVDKALYAARMAIGTAEAAAKLKAAKVAIDQYQYVSGS